MHNFCENFLVALGSNLEFEGGEPSFLLEQALVALENKGLSIRARSRFFQTPAFPAGSGPDFVNAVATLEADLESGQVLERLHAVESQMGRERAQRWGARTLDLDLLAAGQKKAAPSELILPHPRLSERAFVLVPLMDIAPDWVHPLLKLSVREMHDALPQELRDEIIAL
ncbi:UNVERIFIED_CONTAM: hypothetical protein GTU68_036236 [Idotea baltica]|nr:hypothetical protein [Idotea baltica]